MKILKKVLLAMLVAVSLGAVSTTAMAGGIDARTVYKPADAIDIVLKRILAAQNAIESGEDPDKVGTLIKEASDMSKEINANDKVDIARSRANGTLKSARSHAKKGDFQEADAELRKAHKEFSDLKKLL
ncbi:MAG: hypothetical protein ACU84H_14690 [Gammaproteobacteria bacterium]